MYPTISEYIEAIKSAEDNFKELTNLRSVLGDDGQPVMTSGGFAVVFKMEDIETGQFYALKCFIKDQEGREVAYHQIAEELKYVDSPYLVSINYLEKELFVDSMQTEETEFSVLLMDWVEGKTLDKYLRENLDDRFALELLAYRFSQLAQWLIPQPFAHGDLKPDNILVREDGTLVLVDYDGIYVPAMKGQRARELGSPDFRHPQRTEDDFDEHIDDFPFVSILLSLKAISVNPQLLEEYGAPDRLLYSDSNYIDLLKEVTSINDSELNTIKDVLVLFLLKKNIGNISQYLELSVPQIIELSTEDNLKDIWIDEYGAKYSADKKCLLKGVNVPNYSILDGTEIICDNAFENCTELIYIHIPESINSIGSCAFYRCISLKSVNLPEGITHLDWYTFSDCTALEYIYLPDSIKGLWGNAFAGCESLKSINLPDKLEFIGQGCFNCCYNLKSISLPQNVVIECNTFGCCYNLRHVHLPETILGIDDGLFYNCINLCSIIIPPHVDGIGIEAFNGCINLKYILFEGIVDHIDETAFYRCPSLSLVSVPSGSIEKYNRFFYKDILYENNHLDFQITSVTKYDQMFSQNDQWAQFNRDFSKLLRLEDSYGGDEDSDPVYLSEYHINNNTQIICDKACYKNTALVHLFIPASVKYIGFQAFSECDFNYIELPDSLLYINEHAFDGYRGLILVPTGKLEFYASMIPNNKSQLIEINSTDIKKKIGHCIKNKKKEQSCSFFDVFISILHSYCQSNKYKSYYIINGAVYTSYGSKIDVCTGNPYPYNNEISFYHKDSECFVSYKVDPEPTYHIKNTKSLIDIVDAIYYLVIDWGGIELICTNDFIRYIEKVDVQEYLDSTTIIKFCN